MGAVKGRNKETTGAISANGRGSARAPSGPSTRVAQVQALQRQVGNIAVQRGLLDWLRKLRGSAKATEASTTGTPPTTTPSSTASPLTTATGIVPTPSTSADTPELVASAPSLLERFGVAVASPTNIGALRPVYAGASVDERKAIWQDEPVMIKAKAALSQPDLLLLMAELGVYHAGGTVAHATAQKADTEIKAKFSTYVAEAVRIGKKVEGSVVVLSGQAWFDAYYHEFPKEAPRGGPTDEEPTTNAFTTTRPPVNVIVLNKDKGNPATTIHEGLHLYQDDAVLNSFGSNFNEGVTELLTRKVAADLKVVRTNYPKQYDVMVKVKDAVTEAVLTDAYFNGTTSALKTSFVQFRKGKGDSETEAEANWTKLLSHIRKSEYTEAKALC